VESVRIESGSMFGLLTVQRRAASSKNGHARWICQCACGRQITAFCSNLRRGLSRSCGCSSRAKRRANLAAAGKNPDLTGQRFGRLTATARAADRRANYWRCACDCGNESVVRGVLLRNGNTQSCGCYSKEVSAAIGRNNATHGKRHVPEYAIWNQIKQRCRNPNATRFSDYGGRGINVCERWAESFEAFYADMGPRPSSKHSIDRTNNDGNYEPGNCRWATGSQQAFNRRPRGRAPCQPNA
jgi:hypothetical protein